MTDDSIRALIRARLDGGRIPPEWPAGATITAAVAQGYSPAGCTACDRPIQAGESYHVVRTGEVRTLARLHEACERIWDEERRRPGPRLPRQA